MKKLIKIIIWLLAIALVFSIACSIVVALYGRKVIVSQIEENLKVKASIDKVSFGLPLSVNISGLEIGNLLKAERISATPSILGFFAGKVVLSGLTIVNPVINLEQEKDGRLNLPVLEQKGKQPPVLLAGLSVRNGKFIFTDKKIADDYKIILEKINADIAKVKLPLTSLNTNFKFSAVFAGANTKEIGDIVMNGWIDFGPKDVDAVFEIRDLDIVYFTPYLGDFISKRKLLSAKLNLASDLKSKNNDLTISSKFKLSGLTYEKQEAPKEGELQGIDLMKNALDFFADSKGQINLDFNINTKLDNPKIDPNELKEAVLKGALKNLRRQSPQEILDKVISNKEQFKEIGEQLKNIFKKKGE